eukprot:Rmarinus@m.12089
MDRFLPTVPDSDPFYATLLSHCGQHAFTRLPRNEDTNQGRVVLFVSSTFKDMMKERDVINASVMPRLRSRCHDLSLEIVACDLRWGVPAGTSAGETIRTCMGQLKECINENGAPFFLHLSGHRHGWVPTPEDIPSDVENCYGWIQGASITAMEVTYAALQSSNCNALFCLRNDEYLDGISSQDLPSFIDDDPNLRERQAAIRRVIQEKYPNQTAHYCPKTEEDWKDWGDMVYRRIVACLESQFPPLDEKICDSLSAVRGQHAAYFRLVARMSYPRMDLVHTLRRLTVSSDRGALVCIQGGNGMGKSTVLATFCDDLVSAGQPCVFHFVRVADLSDDVGAVARRIIAELRLACEMNPNENDLPGDPREACVMCAQQLRTLQPLKRTVIVVDAVNEIVAEDSKVRLGWLPAAKALSRNISVVVSTVPGGPDAAMLASQLQATVVDIGDLKTADRVKIAENILARSMKQFDDDQMNMYVSRGGARMPLWQNASLEELCRCSKFETVEEDILKIPDEIDALLDAELQTHENELGVVVKALLSLVVVSRSGLRTSEMILVLPEVAAALSPSAVPIESFPSEAKEMPFFQWLQVLSAVQVMLRRTVPGSVPILSATNAVVEDTVKRRYGTCFPTVRRILALFFESAHALPERRAWEAPYQWARLGKTEKLARTLCHECILDHVATSEAGDWQVMSYWRAAGGGEYKLAGSRLVQWVESWLDVDGTLPAARKEHAVKVYLLLDRMCVHPRAIQVLDHLKTLTSPGEVTPFAAWLLTKYGRAYKDGQGKFDATLEANHEAIAIYSRLYGERSVEVAKMIHYNGVTYRAAGRYAEALPLLLEALALREDILGHEHVSVATSLYHIGFVHKELGNFPEAQRCFEECIRLRLLLLGDSHPKVATVLSYLGIVHTKLGEYDLAQQQLQKAVELRKEVFGESHTSVASGLGYLSDVYVQKHDYQKALQLYEECLRIRKTLLGDGHLKVGATLHDLGVLYERQGQPELALRRLREAWKVRTALLASDHPKVLATLRHIESCTHAAILQQREQSAGGLEEPESHCHLHLHTHKHEHVHRRHDGSSRDHRTTHVSPATTERGHDITHVRSKEVKEREVVPARTCAEKKLAEMHVPVSLHLHTHTHTHTHTPTKTVSHTVVHTVSSTKVY